MARHRFPVIVRNNCVQPSEFIYIRCYAASSYLFDSKVGRSLGEGQEEPMAIPDFTIKDQAGFEKVSDEPNQIAGLYFFQALDYLVDLAYGISLDFRKRPQLYRELGLQSGSSLPSVLADLNAKYGNDRKFMARDQRAETYQPVFGAWDLGNSPATDSFP